MALPVIDSVVFDAPSYAPGAPVHVTLKYHGSNNHSVAFTFTGEVIDTATGETGFGSGMASVSFENPLNASGTDSALRTYTVVSDNHKDTAVLTTVA
jgi:hypothetical protein